MDVSLFTVGWSLVSSLILHEVGHILAARVCQVPISQAGFGGGPKLIGIRIRNVDYDLRLLPLGAYVRLDVACLQTRPLIQQLLVLQAGIVVNLVLGILAWGSFFGMLNIILALTNLLPIYQQDGWKTGIVVCRHTLGRANQWLEWSFTIVGVMIGLVIFARAILV